jgi:hypothetical protein
MRITRSFVPSLAAAALCVAAAAAPAAAQERTVAE